MIQRYYFALVAIALLSSIAWMFHDDRITVTSMVAFIAWSVAAIYGGDVERQFAESTVASPVPDEIRLLFGLFALLSLMAAILYRFGVYPPETNEPLEQNPINDR